MGRPKDPTRAKRQTGHRPKPGQTKLAPVPPPTEIVPGAPSAPADLPAEAAEIWDRAIAELLPRGLRPGDLEAIRMMAIAGYRHREAAREIDELGLTVVGPRGPMVNPLLKVEKEQAVIYLRFADAFGLSLSSRLRLGLIQLAGRSLAQSLSEGLDE